MAIIDKRLCAGAFSDISATLYTAPSGVGNISVIKAITLCNITATPVNITLSFDGIVVISEFTIAEHDTITIPFMDHIIEASEVITGFADTEASVNYYISGKEVI